MKKRYGLILLIVLLFLVAPTSTIYAHAAELTTSNADSDQTQDETTEPKDQQGEFEIQEANSSDYQAKLKERLAARKEALKTKLTAAQQKKIAARCKAAQALITKVSDKAKEAKTNRDQIYSNVLTKVTDLRDNLKEDGKDTTKLDTNITELEALVTTFKTDLKDLRQAAVDTSSMDCAADASSFKASLEALKTAREAVAKDSEAVRTYIKDNLKPTLQEIRTSMGEKKEEETN